MRPAWLLLALVAGCDDPGTAPPPSTTGRSIVVTDQTGAGSQAATSQSGAAGAPKKGPRNACATALAKPAPKVSFKATKASGGTDLGASPAFGAGKWVWVNLWAAWCGPCKEEMPRLLAWEKKLRAAGVMLDLAFVSLDDDERQLQRFLEEQPKEGVKASFWLPDGKERSGFLSGAGLTSTTKLPVQVLFAPNGEIRCILEDVVDDADYSAFAKTLGAK